MTVAEQITRLKYVVFEKYGVDQIGPEDKIVLSVYEQELTLEGSMARKTKARIIADLAALIIDDVGAFLDTIKENDLDELTETARAAAEVAIDIYRRAGQ